MCTNNRTEMRHNNHDLRLSQEEPVPNQLVSQHSDVTDTARHELMVTGDPTVIGDPTVTGDQTLQASAD